MCIHNFEHNLNHHFSVLCNVFKCMGARATHIKVYRVVHALCGIVEENNLTNHSASL